MFVPNWTLKLDCELTIFISAFTDNGQIENDTRHVHGERVCTTITCTGSSARVPIHVYALDAETRPNTSDRTCVTSLLPRYPYAIVRVTIAVHRFARAAAVIVTDACSRSSCFCNNRRRTFARRTRTCLSDDRSDVPSRVRRTE